MNQIRNNFEPVASSWSEKCCTLIMKFSFALHHSVFIAGEQLGIQAMRNPKNFLFMLKLFSLLQVDTMNLLFVLRFPYPHRVLLLPHHSRIF